MRVRLIAPRAGGPTPYPAKAKAVFPPFSLAVLAALTPPDWDVEVVDESVQPHDPGSRGTEGSDEKPDLVGITSITATARRAYEIAGQYRSLGTKVVLGGMHVTAVPDEGLRYADAVVMGEAEPVWADVLADAARARLKPVYRGERPSLAGLPDPRRDLFDPRRYIATNLVQTSRGCPNACSFCAVSRFFGATYRTRPIPEVVAEVRRLPKGPVLFVDDNIVGNKVHARTLFEALLPLRIRWIGQSSLVIASDPELLDLAARSGCVGLFIGFESLTQGNLQLVRKGLVNRVDHYVGAIRAIHRRGIAIEGAFIFGLDADDDSVFKRTVAFARTAGLALAQFGVLTPFPGTAVYDQLKAEGRILDEDWSHYTISRTVFQPLQLSRRALDRGLWWAYREFYSHRSIMARMLRAPWRRNVPLFWALNHYFRRLALQPR